MYNILFTGPSEEQRLLIKKQENIEILYMNWVKDNRNASIEECNTKYKQLNS